MTERSKTIPCTSSYSPWCTILAVLIAIAFILVAFAVICPIAFGVVANQKSPVIISFVFLLPCLAAILIMYTYCRGKEKDDKS